MAEPDRNQILDAILAERRSVRAFTDEVPPRSLIEAVVHAGLQAPFAEMAVGDRLDYRRFVVIERGGTILKVAADLMRRRMTAQLERVRQQTKAQPAIAPRVEPFTRRLETLIQNGVPGVGDAPWFVVVAERKGTPAAEQQALAHCLQNMWLKATALGLGFHLVSATALMTEDRAFCELMGVPLKEFELNGCAIGVPKVRPPPRARPTVEATTTWLQ
jgi:nitroreductase